MRPESKVQAHSVGREITSREGTRMSAGHPRKFLLIILAITMGWLILYSPTTLAAGGDEDIVENGACQKACTHSCTGKNTGNALLIGVGRSDCILQCLQADCNIAPAWGACSPTEEDACCNAFAAVGQDPDCGPVCGDGIVNGEDLCDQDDLAGESCESMGFYRGTLACTPECTFDLSDCEGVCGDGVADVSDGEECDDANASNEDACLSTCLSATCGDGYLWVGLEECDDANASNEDDCLNSCLAAACGDGHLWAGFEECDDGNALNEDGCLSTCQLATCGDGHLWVGAEECDDGNTSNEDDCLVTCEGASCGDGYVQAGVEECDDANNDNTDSCPDGPGGTCEQARCGDGHVQAGVEECDDGNENSHDSCSGSCLGETLGWYEMDSPTTELLYAVSILDEDEAWAVGDRGVFLSWNGEEWTQESVDVPDSQISRFNDVVLLSPTLGWAVGYAHHGGTDFDPHLFRWNGSSWEQQSYTGPYTNDRFSRISFVGETYGWIAGGPAYVNSLHRYKNGSWSSSPVWFPDGDLVDVVEMVSETEGWATCVRNGSTAHDILYW
ncbi:DUF4215 domain-containing protein, partial [Myxococcota bacterium]